MKKKTKNPKPKNLGNQHAAKSEEDKKLPVKIYFTPSEIKTYRKLAKDVNIPLSKWIRDKLRKIIFKKEPGE